MDFGFLNGINCLFTLILVFGVILSIYVAQWGFKWSILSFILVAFIMCFGLSQAYEKVLFADSLAYRYKIAIEQGQSNGFSERYYESASNQDSINQLMASININKGRIGYEYGYGASDVDREPIALYISSVKAEHYAPVIVPGVICFLWWFGLFLVRRSAERTDKKLSEQRTELEKLEEHIKFLDDKRNEQERIIKAFDPETLKLKSADLISDIRKSERKLSELRNDKAKLYLEVSELKTEKEKLSEKLVSKSTNVDERKRLMRI
mgnify:FL=1